MQAFQRKLEKRKRERGIMDYTVTEDSQGRMVFCKEINGEKVYRRVPSDEALDESLRKHMADEANLTLPHGDRGINGYHKKLHKLIMDNAHDSMLSAWAERVKYRSLLALDRYYATLDMNFFGEETDPAEVDLFDPLEVDLFTSEPALKEAHNGLQDLLKRTPIATITITETNELILVFPTPSEVEAACQRIRERLIKGTADLFGGVG